MNMNKWAGSGSHLNYKRHFNLVGVGSRAHLGWQAAARWDTQSYVALSTSAWAGATHQIQFVWAMNKNKWAGSGRHLNYKRRYNLVCVGLRAHLGWPAAACWDTTSYVALSTSAWAGATDQTKFVWAMNKNKWAGSGRHLNYKRHFNLVGVGLRAHL
jgi:hypothetical protein